MMAGWVQHRILRLFRRLSRISLWFETRFTDTGRVVLAGAIGATIFGLDPRQTDAIQLAALLLATLVVAASFALRWRPQLEVVRLLPDTVTVGVPAHYRLAVTNRGRRVEAGLVLFDVLRTRYPDAKAFSEPVTGEREAGLNWFDRRAGFPRWLGLLRRGRGGRIEPQALPPIRPGETVRIDVTFVPLRRGKIVFDGVLIKRADPLQVFYAAVQLRIYAELISLPQRFPVPRLQWRSERHFHPGGLTLAATVGDSEEFMGLREYRPGDPLRHIHWRSFARLGEPVVKEYQDEYFDRHALLIDTFAGAATTAEFETAVAVAASLIQSERPSDSILDLVFIDREVWRMTTGRGLSNNRQVLIQLAELKRNPIDEFERLAGYARRYVDRLASVVLVCTAWDPARAAFIAGLRHRRVNCLVLQVAETNAATVAVDVADPGVHPDTCNIRPSAPAVDLAAISTGVTG
jgi:uncharacterized protein (DUF58 family)